MMSTSHYEMIDNFNTEEDEVKKKVLLFKIIAYYITFVFGLLANIFVIVVILLLREYKKSSFQWYVLQLAIADSALIISMPFQLSEDLNDEWIFPEWMCKAKESVLFISYYSSIMLLTVMSINRYVGICHPMSSMFYKLRKPKVTLIIATCIWGISILLTVPVILHSALKGVKPNCKCTNIIPTQQRNNTETCLSEGKITKDELEKCLSGFAQENIQYCIDPIPAYNPGYFGPNISDYDWNLNQSSENDPQNESDYYSNTSPSLFDIILPDCHYIGQSRFWTVFLVVTFVIFFVVPLMIMTVSYGMIIRKLLNNSDNMDQFRNEGQSHITEERKNVTIICAALVSCFAICWLPFHAVHLAKLAVIKTNAPGLCYTLSVVSTWLAYLNSALNPFLYTFVVQGIAQRLRSLKSTAEVKWIIMVFAGFKTKKQSTGQNITIVTNTSTKRHRNVTQSSPQHHPNNSALAPPSK